MSFKFRIYFTAIITLAIGSLLAWDHFHDGVPSHHILADKTLPSISNWWGVILLPLLTWFLLFRIQQTMIRTKEDTAGIANKRLSIIYGLIGSLLFGILLSVFFTLDYTELPGYMMLCLFLLALVIPIYRAEYLLGFVIGMTFTFGAILPTGVGSILVSVFAILYLYIRPGIQFVFSKLGRLFSGNK